MVAVEEGGKCNINEDWSKKCRQKRDDVWYGVPIRSTRIPVAAFEQPCSHFPFSCALYKILTFLALEWEPIAATSLLVSCVPAIIVKWQEAFLVRCCDAQIVKAESANSGVHSRKEV